jgi:hypothetical protein
MAIFGEHELMLMKWHREATKQQVRKEKQNQFRAILAFVIHQSSKILTTITHLLLLFLDARQKTSKMQRCMRSAILGRGRNARWQVTSPLLPPSPLFNDTFIDEFPYPTSRTGLY